MAITSIFSKKWASKNFQEIYFFRSVRVPVKASKALSGVKTLKLQQASNTTTD
tara:strand:+ start:119 stop:277 length:159 start_codon:yes stop_codon:yes gene_type:complete